MSLSICTLTKFRMILTPNSKSKYHLAKTHSHNPGVTGGLFEYSQHGDLLEHIREEWWREHVTKRDRLRIAGQVAAALSDVHALSIVHTDITSNQYIFIDGRYKLNDFNRCRFIKWTVATKQECPFYMSKNWGKVS